jgi:urate oxidase / 2-oxo-4-hydroxy-4-carboxy-5-ureidoimidazoline decarboxylase
MIDEKIDYGKSNIAIYRTYAGKMTGITPIPESPFHGQDNILFAVDLDITVYGSTFRPSYTEGDNSMVVPTATMTNFAFHQTLNYTGATLEGLLYFLCKQFLTTYPQMERVRLSAKELPFVAAPITQDTGQTVTPSDRLFAPSHDSYGVAMLEMERDADGGLPILDHASGREEMKLIKITGSAFANFVRDQYTTLPEKNDRPLYIYLDMGWNYHNVNDAISNDLKRYIPAAQVYDIVRHCFHDFVSMSIQHLVYEMGCRLLNRFPQMNEVWFTSQNRLWDTMAETRESDAKAYGDPRPPFGRIGLKLNREDL